MSTYSHGKFSEGAYSNETISELPYQLKLSVDILSVKNFTLSANVITKFSVNLQAAGSKNNRTLVHHNFAAKDATPVNQGAHDTKIQDSFASFEFIATKSELGSVLHKCEVDISILHQVNGKEIGRVAHPLKHLETGEQKKTPASVVIVSDKYVELKLDGKVSGLVRVVLYLEDLGVVKGGQGKPISQTSAQVPIQAANTVEDQIVWQLEMWKRAEMAKFMAHLKQKEIEKVDELAQDWKFKEQQRELAYNEAVTKVAALENKVRVKATDLQRREERIIQLEEELKSKIHEVSKQLTTKEEEIISIKKKFKEERIQLETDKKKAIKEASDAQDKAQLATTKYFNLKKEADESPLQVLRNELGTKQLEVAELEQRLKTSDAQKEEFRNRYEQVKKDMVALKRQIDREKEETLERQAKELEQLKGQMRLNEARDAERREFEAMRNQFATMADKLSNQAQLEAEKAAKDKKNRFGARTTGAMEVDKNVYFDDFARKKESPKKDLMTINVESRSRDQPFAQGFSRPGTGKGPCEWDRLMKEREELLQSGCYNLEDPLIKEIERQISASQQRDNRIAAI